MPVRVDRCSYGRGLGEEALEVSRRSHEQWSRGILDKVCEWRKRNKEKKKKIGSTITPFLCSHSPSLLVAFPSSSFLFFSLSVSLFPLSRFWTETWIETWTLGRQRFHFHETYALNDRASALQQRVESSSLSVNLHYESVGGMNECLLESLGKNRLGPFCMEKIKNLSCSMKWRSLLRVIRDVSGLID